MIALRHIAGLFAIHRFPPDAQVPGRVLTSDVFSVTRTPSELSVVCRSGLLGGRASHSATAPQPPGSPPDASARPRAHPDAPEHTTPEHTAPEHTAPEHTTPEHTTPEHTEDGWSCLEVEGPLPFTMTGVLAGLSQALAAVGISLFAVSTFDTDYLFVKTDDLTSALAALRGAGYVIP